MAPKILNREDWLNKLAAKIQPWLDEINQAVVFPFRITCGWPSSGGLSTRPNRTIGQCWATETSTDDHAEIFISPVLDDPVEVAATVAHELLHASGLKGHRRNFAAAAGRIGLEGPATGTVAGDAFKQRIHGVLEALGPYPHARIDYTKDTKKTQTTRLLKVTCLTCEEDGEPYLVRMSQATLDRGAPWCPIHQEPMTAGGDDSGRNSQERRTSGEAPRAPEEAETEHPASPVPAAPAGHGGPAAGGEAAGEGVTVLNEAVNEADVVYDVNKCSYCVHGQHPRCHGPCNCDHGVTQAQCAGGDGFRGCREFKGLMICARHWRKRQSLADNKGGSR